MMGGARFDTWTRRRCGLAAAGALATVLGLSGSERAGARRRKRRKRRCEKLGTRCNPRNDRKLCCGDLACGIVPELGAHHCCHQRFALCHRDADCCNNLRCVAGAVRICDIVVS